MSYDRVLLTEIFKISEINRKTGHLQKFTGTLLNFAGFGMFAGQKPVKISPFSGPVS